MKASIAATAAILIASASAQPSVQRQSDPTTIHNAVVNWQTDTGLVSGFVDSVQGYLSSGDNAGFLFAAGHAYTSENDELTWKGMLDNGLCRTGDPNYDPVCANAIATANNELVNKDTFGTVVLLLKEMGTSGLSIAAQNQYGINCGSAFVGGRCYNVLPAIGTYFTYAAYELCTYYGDCSLNGATAIFPQTCSECPVPA
ncbi:hypothetical protein B0A54_08885 [Friedmanniomyces endolithicus]|uniref:Uncharacterized protein n=1 Tax=Friedmanniomyces endolithicus TaxID=329885 RepID=A0A4U0UVL2_9PEZI|nr:hypothetical protein LTS09_007535 [Friedmanniomyces endolithicus]TKA40097.1 hypothetical protein B0A54_08885 [Friedmanniomyces endolithicus]